MPASEYSTGGGGGGKLKLKGSKVSDGRVEKKKKESSSKKKNAAAADPEEGAQQQQQQQQAHGQEPPQDEKPSGSPVDDDRDESSPGPANAAGKTEAERKHEDMKRRRLQERLKREGVKTHKERVEELNKYLSRLSEHHDMPKIGPG
ncbi:DUF1754-domain-containing protein [Aspergillus ellipticus CBS 707.79]|uniref:DUF1754-domain-containing protein n=1 Tax=Aspergillus ellipticus CBS 707.79 TaxID=1448320 RepID=A0A319F407_9EURO|nr:DUF1754-domain-containing protein [Aspergillus ellipticus CBS 707.79]